MKNKTSLKDIHYLIFWFISPLIFWILLSLLFGCTQITEPEIEGISGVYQSKMYSAEDLIKYNMPQTYALELDLLQRGDIFTGLLTDFFTKETFKIDGYFEYKDGENDVIRLNFAYGLLHLFVIRDKKKLETYPFPLIGECIYYSGARSIRFEKTGEPHNQGMIQ